MRRGIIFAPLAGALLMASTAVASAQAPDWCRSQGGKNAAERTICATRSLWSLDEQLNVAYGNAEDRLGSQRQQLQSSQANWLRGTRNACGASVNCLSRAYRNRIATLEDIRKRGHM